MKKTLFFILLSSFLYTVHAQEVLEFEGRFPGSTSIKKYVSARPDAIRLKSEIYGKFNVEFEGFNEQQKFAFGMAVKLWEEAISISKPVYIKATFNGAGNNAYISSCVTQPDIVDGVQTNTFLPQSLLAQKTDAYNNPATGGREDPDITIHFNGNMDIWDFNTDFDTPLLEGKYDFVTAALRALTQGMGFGAALNGREGRVAFKINPPNYYVFDQRIKNEEGIILTSLQKYSDELNSFVKAEAYFDMDNYIDYQLYTPAAFTKNITLCYFDSTAINDNEKALMAPECNGRTRHIGSAVLNVLNQIGWSKRGDFKIVNDEIDASGIIDHQPNRTLTFTCTSNPFVTSYEWSFTIPQKDGTYRTLSTGTNANFTFNLPDNYLSTDERTSSGAIKGRIHVKTSTSDDRVMEADYALFINYFPPNPIVEIRNVEITGDYSCNLEIGFASLGASSYSIEVVDEDAFFVWDLTANQPGYATYTIRDLFIGGNYTITVTAISARGNSASDPLHFNALDMNSNTLIIESHDSYITIKNRTEMGLEGMDGLIEGLIIDASGRILKTFLDNSVSIVDLKNGVYIIRVKNHSGEVFTEKFIK